MFEISNFLMFFAVPVLTFWRIFLKHIYKSVLRVAVMAACGICHLGNICLFCAGVGCVGCVAIF